MPFGTPGYSKETSAILSYHGELNHGSSKTAVQSCTSLKKKEGSYLSRVFGGILCTSKMASAKIEFAVNMTCQKCVDSVRNSLTGLNGIDSVDVSLYRGTVVVETKLPYSTIQEKIEETGKKAVLKGYGDSTSAVSMLGGNSGYSVSNEIKGVIRFAETKDGCVIDGTVDGLTPGMHGIHIHECGDISKGCESVGEHFNPNNTAHGGPDDDPVKRHVGDLGNIEADNIGRATFRKLDKLLKIPDIIGRSLVITEKPDDLGQGDNPESKINGNSGTRLACGIIARSSGLFQNTKKICACDGLTIWDERDKALSNAQDKNIFTGQGYNKIRTDAPLV